jgi:exodeoxyribonuclease VII small subunit
LSVFAAQGFVAPASGYRALLQFASLFSHLMPAKTSPKTAPLSFEDALSELERLADTMEDGAQPLETMLGDYQRAAALLQQCKAQLQAVETQVKVIDANLGAAQEASA